MKEEKLPILFHGEAYIETVQNISGYGKKKYPREYDEARINILNDLKKLYVNLEKNQRYFLNEKVICLRLEPSFEAKSYCPYAVASLDNDTKIIGGRKYNINDSEKAKMYFARINENGLNAIMDHLRQGRKTSDNWKNQICSLKAIDLEEPDEKIAGFPADWKNGIAEFIIHPMGSNNKDEAVKKFFQLSGIDYDVSDVRTYADGLTFIAAKVDRNCLDQVKFYNPLRSIHPLFSSEEPVIRSFASLGPEPPVNKPLSNLLVGAFDGGIEEDNPYFKGYARNHECVSTPKSNLKHGTSVAGAVLYGNVTDPDQRKQMETPPAFLEMFRVLPEENHYGGSDTAKIGMYNTIDTIEKIVRGRKDIKLFNLSCGPHMPVIDDDLTRFTYVLDQLSYEVSEDENNPLFVVAVGNDGKLEEPLNRIQPPSDMVNGLSVGAYTKNSADNPVRAVYSCIGPGREGCKVKPDILEFGGSQDHPFVTVSEEKGSLELYCGTSLAAPYALHKIALMMADSESLSPHMCRTLLIHSAYQTDHNGRNNETGYGYAAESVDGILNCDAHNVTVLYEGKLSPSMTARIPIFSPDINHVKGNVTITWTIATIVSPDCNDTDAYTSCCIEDTFYPNSKKYNFYKDRLKRAIDLSKPNGISEADFYLSHGYTKSHMPVSKPATIFANESELRNRDLKWDTVVKKQTTSRGSSLLNPFITIHAISRNPHDQKPVRYFMAVTIHAESYMGSLYDEILKTYNRIEPIRLRQQNVIKVNNRA